MEHIEQRKRYSRTNTKKSKKKDTEERLPIVENVDDDVASKASSDDTTNMMTMNRRSGKGKKMPCRKKVKHPGKTETRKEAEKGAAVPMPVKKRKGTAKSVV